MSLLDSIITHYEHGSIRRVNETGKHQTSLVGNTEQMNIFFLVSITNLSGACVVLGTTIIVMEVNKYGS
jgi:hypothetical protein